MSRNSDSCQHGSATPWPSLHSEVAAPSSISVHQLLMDAERWVACYNSASYPTVAVFARVATVIDRIGVHLRVAYSPTNRRQANGTYAPSD